MLWGSSSGSCEARLFSSGWSPWADGGCAFMLHHHQCNWLLQVYAMHRCSRSRHRHTLILHTETFPCHVILTGTDRTTIDRRQHGPHHQSISHPLWVLVEIQHSRFSFSDQGLLSRSHGRTTSSRTARHAHNPLQSILPPFPWETVRSRLYRRRSLQQVIRFQDVFRDLQVLHTSAPL